MKLFQVSSVSKSLLVKFHQIVILLLMAVTQQSLSCVKNYCKKFISAIQFSKSYKRLFKRLAYNFCHNLKIISSGKI